MPTEISILQPVASRTELHLVLGRHRAWMVLRLNGTAVKWHRGWMAPWLNGTAAEWHSSSIRHVWVWNVCFTKRDVLSLGEWLPSCSGSSSPYGHPLTHPDRVTIFRNVCVHTYLHKDTTSHLRRQESLANLQWQYKISDRNTKFPDCPPCPSFCIFPYSDWRTGDRMSVKVHSAKVCHNQVSYSPTANRVTHGLPLLLSTSLTTAPLFYLTTIVCHFPLLLHRANGQLDAWVTSIR